MPGGGFVLPGMTTLVKPIATLVPDPANARAHSRRNLDSIRASLIRFGQRTPLVVQRQGMVVRKGNGTLECIRELGWTHCAYVVVDESSVDAVAYAIADNRAGELSEWDLEALQTNVAALIDDGVFLEDAGFTREELDAILAIPDWDEDGGEGDPDDTTSYKENVTVTMEDIERRGEMVSLIKELIEEHGFKAKVR